MQFRSTRGGENKVSFGEAVLKGLAPDGGLYVPEEIVPLDQANLTSGLSLPELGAEFLWPYVDGLIERTEFDRIVTETLNFEIPLVEVGDGVFALELYHGPTLAFKDVGARFMGRVLPVCNDGRGDVVVLVATSGDTGGAVAHGLYDVPGVQVVILYPKGKVSFLQERQFASLGRNVAAVAVDGYFDDCQRLVKEAFADKSITERISLTTANSINVARWMPQAVYYLWLYAQRQDFDLISVPSGNFGNLTAGLLALRSGLPAAHFIAACNANDTVPQYLISGDYTPKASIRTIANAMDVGAPSNFERLLDLYRSDWQDIRSVLSGEAFLDDQIGRAIIDCYGKYGYLLDPHGACGYLALKKHLKEGEKGVFLATAHPAKFDEVYGDLGMAIPKHDRLEELRDRTLHNSFMKADPGELRQFLITNY